MGDGNPVIPLGGRFFRRPERTTARQDAWQMRHVGDAGLHAFIGRDLTDEATVAEFVLTILRSGEKFHLLAGALVEDGKAKWTEADAEANAEWFADLDEPEDKATLEREFLATLRGFFGTAGRSSTPSPSSSSPRSDVAEPATLAPPAESPFAPHWTAGDPVDAGASSVVR
jgi:hypothetical protein